MSFGGSSFKLRASRPIGGVGRAKRSSVYELLSHATGFARTRSVSFFCLRRLGRDDGPHLCRCDRATGRGSPRPPLATIHRVGRQFWPWQPVRPSRHSSTRSLKYGRDKNRGPLTDRDWPCDGARRRAGQFVRDLKQQRGGRCRRPRKYLGREGPCSPPTLSTNSGSV